MKDELREIGAYAPKDISFLWATYLQFDNLKNCLPAIANGVPFQEGNDKTAFKGNHGYFFVSDGKTLERIINDKVMPKKYIKPFQKVSNLNEAKEYMMKVPGDGAYFIDNENMGIAKVGKIFPPGEAAERIDEYGLLPDDFIIKDAKIPARDSKYGLGTKTIVALMLPQIYKNVRTTVVKSSPYGETGMGVVAGIGSDGIEERVFFVKDKRMKISGIGKFVDKRTGEQITLGRAWDEGLAQWEMVPGMLMRTYRKMFRTQLKDLRCAGFELVDFIDCRPIAAFKKHDAQAYNVFSKYPLFSIYVAQKK